MTTISKKELAQRMVKNTKISQTQAETILSELLEQTKKALIKGEEIRLIGYFSLKTAITKPRMAMNLQTKKKGINIVFYTKVKNAIALTHS